MAPLVRGVEPTASVTIGEQFSTTSIPGPGAKQVTQGMLPVGKSISGGGADDAQIGLDEIAMFSIL